MWPLSQGSTNSHSRCCTKKIKAELCLDLCWEFDIWKFKTRKWKIQILQYECNHPAIAPEGCLQVQYNKNMRMFCNDFCSFWFHWVVKDGGSFQLFFISVEMKSRRSNYPSYRRVNYFFCFYVVAWAEPSASSSGVWMIHILIAVLHGHLRQCVQFQLETRGQ